MRGVGDALVDLGRDLLDRALPLGEHIHDLSAPPASQRLGEAFAKLDALNLPPLTPEEVQAEIDQRLHRLRDRGQLQKRLAMDRPSSTAWAEPFAPQSPSH